MALGAIGLLTLVNVRGVAEAAVVQIVRTVLKLVPLVLIGSVVLIWIDSEHFTPVNASGQPDLAAISAAAALTLWTCLGWSRRRYPRERSSTQRGRSPRHDAGVLIAAAVYISVTTVAIGVLPNIDLS